MSNHSTLTVKRVIKADPETIFKAFTDEQIMKKWFYADPEGSGATVKSNTSVGGKFQIDMHGKKDTHTHIGEFKEVVPNKKLVFTWNSHVVEDTVVTITFNETNEGTEVTLVHEFMPNEQLLEGHKKGWNVILDHLDEIVS
ncbi:MAG: SRPBCC domain-containing protein [Gracilimonas sp.]